MDQLTQLLEVKSHEWWKVKGLIIGFGAIIAVAAAFQTIFSQTLSTTIILSLLSFLWLGVWLYKNKIRKARKDSVGIVLCIYSNDADVDKQIREDFITSLQASLSNSDVNQFSDIIVLPFHIAARFENAKEAVSILDRAKAHYLIFGLVRKRGEKHILDLTAHVRHVELRNESKQKFSRDISNAWVPRYNLKNADETFELFEVTSNIVSLCSQYIIGLAAFASLDFSTAETLFVGVRDAIRAGQYPDFPAIREIRKSVTHRINQIYLIQARTYLQIWSKTREKENIVIARSILDKIFGAYRRDGEFITLGAICEVLLTQNYNAAKGILTRIKAKKRDAIWCLNIGFIAACQKNENDMIEYYEQGVSKNEASAKPIDLDKISEFEDFLVWYKENVNPSPLLWYGLAYLNDHFKGDKEQAISDYRNFLDESIEADMTASRSLALKRIEDLGV